MPEAILGNVAGAVVGGLMSDGGGSQQTASKEPWAPAVKPLTNSLETGQGLERYYQQNPFNVLQQQGYQNLFSDLDQYRSQIAPGLMNMANSMMGYNYQRGPRNSQVEAMQAQQKPMLMQGADGAYAPQGLLAQSAVPQGLMAPQGVFQAPSQGNYGLLNFAALNAHNSIPKAPEAAAAPAAEVDPATKPYNWRDDYDKLLRGQLNYTGAGA